MCPVVQDAFHRVLEHSCSAQDCLVGIGHALGVALGLRARVIFHRGAECLAALDSAPLGGGVGLTQHDATLVLGAAHACSSSSPVIPRGMRLEYIRGSTVAERWRVWCAGVVM